MDMRTNSEHSSNNDSLDDLARFCLTPVRVDDVANWWSVRWVAAKRKFSAEEFHELLVSGALRSSGIAVAYGANGLPRHLGCVKFHLDVWKQINLNKLECCFYPESEADGVTLHDPSTADRLQLTQIKVDPLTVRAFARSGRSPAEYACDTLARRALEDAERGRELVRREALRQPVATKQMLIDAIYAWRATRRGGGFWTVYDMVELGLYGYAIPLALFEETYNEVKAGKHRVGRRRAP
jgi:hypothetical protein